MSEPNTGPCEALDPVLVRAAAALRGFRLPAGPQFDEQVMAAVRQCERPTAIERRRRVFGTSRWATAADRMEFRPVRGLATAAGLVAILATGIWLGRQSVTLPGTTVAAVSSATESEVVHATASPAQTGATFTQLSDLGSNKGPRLTRSVTRARINRDLFGRIGTKVSQLLKYLNW